MTTLLLLAAGFPLLIVGADFLVRGAARLARSLGMSPLVIGLTVVALGTSAPELAVSLQAAARGQGDLTVGNVIGSNICNVLFILGLSALVLPLVVAQRLIRIDVPLMVALSILTLVLASNGSLGRLEGLVLVGALVGYTAFSIYEGRRSDQPADAGVDLEGQRGGALKRTGWNLGLIAAGTGMLVAGARLLVEGATDVALELGLSDLVVGLTIVALGTSLPEAATSVAAALRGERDMAVGNVVGSNILNLVAVLGLSSLISPQALAVSSAAINFDMPVMIAVAAACLPIFFTGRLVARWEGALFLTYYLAYMLYLLLNAADHAALEPYSLVMLFFVVPLTLLTVLGMALLQLRRLLLAAMLRRHRRASRRRA